MSAAMALVFAAARGSANPGDPLDEVRQMHEEMHAAPRGMGTGRHSAAMNEMHREMSGWLSGQDRALHDRMHEACTGLTTERKDT